MISLTDLLLEKSVASKKAAKLGLVHKGFGYYGPEGEEGATHRSAEGGQKLYKLKSAYGKKVGKKATPKKKAVKKSKAIMPKKGTMGHSMVTAALKGKLSPKVGQIKTVSGLDADAEELGDVYRENPALVKHMDSSINKLSKKYANSPSTYDRSILWTMQQVHDIAKHYSAKKEKKPKKKTITKKKKKEKVDPTQTYKTEKVGKSVIHYHTPKVQKKVEKAAKPIVAGEEVHVWPSERNKAVQKLIDELGGETREIKKISRNYARQQDKYGKQQAKTWTAALENDNEKAYNNLMMVQSDWQGDSQYLVSPKQRKKRNKFLNETLMGKNGAGKPAVTKVPPTGIERGMVMKEKDLKKFLANFKVGRKVVIPPSGWSASPETARNFGPAAIELGRGIGIIMKLRPKKGSNNSMIGYNCVGAGVNLEKKVSDYRKKYNQLERKIDPIADKLLWQDDTRDAKYQKLESQYEKLIDEQYQIEIKIDELEDRLAEINEYEHESEIIRPGSVAQKVVSIKRHVISDPGRPGIIYEIELEDAGPVSRKLWMEKDLSLINKYKAIIKQTLYQYMNGTVGFKREEAKSKKSVDRKKRRFKESR